MTYRTLDSASLVDTIARLARRIEERFPGAGLTRVAAELAEVARTTADRVDTIARPNAGLRLAVALVSLAGIGGLAWLVGQIDIRQESENVFGAVQGIEAAFNVIIIIGAAILFLVSAERRLKRQRALTALHELRSIVHVVDMHQLTKDPSAVLDGGHATSSSPKRDLTPFELGRYLDYCSEMLSLTAKVAALYAQALPDGEVVSAVADIEQLTTNLSHKIWQKIAIVQAWTSPGPTPRAASAVTQPSSK